MKLIFSKLEKCWSELFIIATMLIGSTLIFSTRYLVPVFVDVISETFQKNDAIVNYSARISWQIEKIEPEYIFFLPYISSHQKSTTLHPGPPISVNVFERINFSAESERINITIFPRGLSEEDGKPIQISFMPSEECNFGDGNGCVNEFSSSAGNRIIFVSVHSGLGGEADGFRDLLEGTGLNQGLYNPAEVQKRVQYLSGSEITIIQGEYEITNLSLKAIIRIPPEQLKIYIDLPIPSALEYALEQTYFSQEFIDQDLLIIETCGWRLPHEPQIDGLPQNSNSTYLGIVGVNGD